MKKTQRWLCLLLVLCMLLSVLPVTAMAAETGAEPSAQAAGTAADFWAGQLPMTSDLPTEYTIVADVALVKGRIGSGCSAGVTFQQTDGRNFTISGWIMA